jgi:hypothetical protein
MSQSMENRLSIQQCRKLIPESSDLSDDQLEKMRDLLYTVADVISDAFIDLANIDQSLFWPPGAITEQLERLLVEEMR